MIRKSFYDAFCNIHAEMCASKQFSAELSGTTLSALFLNGDRLYTANVGDSRIILISFDPQSQKDDDFKYRELTTDHKPDSV